MSAAKKKLVLDGVEKLGDGMASEVFSGRDQNTNTKYIIKKIHPDFMLEGVEEHIKQQIDHLKRLEIPDVLIPEFQCDAEQKFQLVQIFPEGELLSTWLAERKRVDIRTVLEIGIALTESLALRHRAAHIHKAIKPNNIVIQEEPVRIQLVDEVQVVDATQLSQFVNNSHYRRQSLPYAAPEISRQIRSHLDYCSDLYSVGTVLYECITGTPPFLSDDSLSIVHSHLAEEPLPAIELNEDCPRILSEIIGILLHKPLEKRYQSATGLLADLQTCLSRLKADESGDQRPTIPAFKLQQREASHHIKIPSIMVGRDQQQQQLLDEYQRTCTGKLGLVSLSGLSGVGKTRLIQELELPIIARQGYFAFGKCNQFASHLPYAPLLDALSRLIRQILTEDTARIADWRKRMQEALGADGQIVTSMVPELEAIVGVQPELKPLPANEARTRFNNLYCRYMTCLASERHPLVLFLDDLQWCDQGTFDLLSLLFNNPEDHPYLMVIGAYRSNEVNEEHFVIRMESKLEQFQQPMLKLELKPLSKTATNQMVAHILNTTPSHTKELTNAIYNVAGGNPLYVSESLRWLHKSERLHLSEGGHWVWDKSKVTEVDIPIDATTLFFEKLKLLPTNVQDLLATAALLGAQFDAADLAAVAQISLPKLYDSLRDVFAQRILQVDKERLYFFHDQIQAAASNLLSDEQRRQRHHTIAKTYIDRHTKTTDSSAGMPIPNTELFSIVEHLAAARLAGTTDEERLEEAKFNYQAGLAAMDGLALDASNHYFVKSIELCTEAIWVSDYEFMLSLHKNLAHAALINGDQNRANEIVEGSLKFVDSDLDIAEFLYEQSVAYAALGELHKAIEIAARAIAIVDQKLPVQEADIQQEIIERQQKLYDNRRELWQELIDIGPSTGRLDNLTQKLYGEILGYFYFSGQIQNTRIAALRSIDYSLQHGVDDFTCYAAGCMAFFLRMDGHYLLAYSYESVTFELAKQHPNTFGAVKGKGAILWASAASRHSISELNSLCRDTAQEGIRCGELRYAGLAKCVEHWYGFFQGDDFSLLDRQLIETNQFNQQCNLAMNQAVGEATLLSLRPLLVEQRPPEQSQDISEQIEQWHIEEQGIALACYYTFSGVVAYYNHKIIEAEQFLDQAEPLLSAVSTSIVEVVWFIFRYLVGLNQGFKNSAESYLGKLLEWSSHGPLLKPYLALIDAEIAARKGDFRHTRSCYLDAIDSANEEGYVLLEAFLNERLYQHAQQINHHSSELYRNQANDLYHSCGAVNRVENPSAVILPFGRRKSDGLVKTPLPAPSGQNIDDELDIQFLFDAVKAISSELDLDKLTSAILTSVMTRLGAKTGYLLIAEGSLLQPRFKTIKTDTISVISSQEATFNTDKLCSAIVNYVFNSKEKVILENAMDVGEFVADKTVQENKLRSILCIPIIMQTEVLGVLYFENSLIESVFTETQVSHADLLTSQAAIALQNAKLLQDTKSAQDVITQMNRDLETTVEERTQELQRKQLELTHAGRLASLGELATGIAHELGQPLQIIQVASRIIEDELVSDEFDKNEVIPFTKDIIEQIERATAIVTNMRNYARNDDAMAAENTDVSVPFNQCLVFFTEQFHQHQISLLLDIEDNLPNVLVNQQTFQQIVVNLFSNARYAVDKKAPCDGYHKQIISRLYRTYDKKSVVLEVEDNGIGMTEEVREKCMDPFFTTKEVGEGTGLGLSIVHGLIQEFGFSLDVTSQPNKGSLFKIVMPASTLS